jgi:glutamate racemase
VSKSSLPIGVFDSGVGGVTVASKLKEMFPHEDFIYVGDTKRNPYGQRSVEQIIEFSLEIVKYLESKSIKLGVIACNTITVTAIEAIRKVVNYPVIGVASGIKTAATMSKNKKIAVLATQATINSHCHRKIAAEDYPELTILEQPCPVLAHLIETGNLSGEEIEEPIREYLQPIMEAGVDTAVLGCTHFPFVQELMEEVSCHQIAFVNPAMETALEVKNLLEKEGLLNLQQKTGSMELCFTEGAERGGKLAGISIPAGSYSVKEILIPPYK